MKFFKQKIYNTKMWNQFFTVLVSVMLSASLLESRKSNAYTSFNSKMYCNPFSKILEPSSVDDILKIVRQAITKGKTVKAIGALHSSTDVICTDGIPISMRKINDAHIGSNGSATFGAGIELGAAMFFLEQHQRMIPIVPAYSKITIGGAIATGAHGASLRHPATISDNVIGLTIIDGKGTLMNVTSENEVNALKVNLGLLGIVTHVTLKTLPLQKLTVHNKLENEGILQSDYIMNLARQLDMFQIWWFANTAEVVTSKGTFVPISTPGNASTNFIFSEHRFGVAKSRAAFEILQGTRNTQALEAFAQFAKESLYKEVVGKPPIYSPDGETLSNPATGFPWRLQASSCEPTDVTTCSWDNGNESIYPEEMSLAFDIDKFSEVINVIKKRVKANPFFTLLGFFIRFMKKSTAFVSIGTGRDSFTIGWLMPIRKNRYYTALDQLGSSQALFQELVQNYGGRPHWGKNGLQYFSHEMFAKTVPNRKPFLESMEKFDPKGLFLNKFAYRLQGVSDSMDISPAVKHCAVDGYCICKFDTDCAPFQLCSRLNGFRVCRDKTKSNPPFQIFSTFANISNILETIENNLFPHEDEFEFRKTHSWL